MSSTEFNPQAQAINDRLAALNYDEPYFNADKVVEHMRRHYELLGVEMPQVQIADNMVIGFEIAWGAARGAAWDAAWGAAWGAARGAARGAAWGAARGAAWGAALDAAWGAALDAAWGAANIAGALQALPNDPKVLKFVEIETELLQALENGLGFYFPMRDRLVLVPIPRMILNAGRLHYDHGKAVEWADGTGFYFLRGVRFDDEKLYKAIIDQKLTAEQTLKIGNADQRAAAISMLRPDRLLKQMQAELLHTGQKGTKLYRVKNFMGTRQTEYCIHMQDASTDREFIEWVEPKVGEQGDADLCQATAFGIALEDYLNMEQEA